MEWTETQLMDVAEWLIAEAAHNSRAEARAVAEWLVAEARWLSGAAMDSVAAAYSAQLKIDEARRASTPETRVKALELAVRGVEFKGHDDLVERAQTFDAYITGGAS